MIEENNKDKQELTPNKNKESIQKISGMYENWFLDYASYVILERAIPSVYDGLKPVQRRILHSMRELEDGRYNKVANVVGNTMKYHPHGDAAITDAIVQLGQKELLIDTQGNWGNIYTGDGAAAARYIESRLTPFALDVVFNPKTTIWKPSYDGRNKEPENLPVKFPLLLSQGVEGIAVGLSTKILPHNFIEIIDAIIAYLKGKSFVLYPDFQTGGLIDISNYNDGERGGKIRARAKLSNPEKGILKISEIPYGTNTGSIIDSILKANDKGKIKIKKVEDNTASEVEILIHLGNDVSPDKMMDALYAFTDCEISISPNACVINVDKPEFLSVSQILRKNTDHTVSLLKKELEIELDEFQEQWHFASLERIFIENRIYHNIEEVKTWEEVISTIDLELKPFTSHLIREVTEEDILKLIEIRIKKITRFDLGKAEENILALEGKIAEAKYNLENLIQYAIDYFTNIKKKYGKGKERKTEIRAFDTIDAAKVAVANIKFYVNREEGFIGYSLKKDEFLFDCSDIDDIIIFRKDGTMLVTKAEAKTFVGKNIIYVGVWKKNDNRTIYNLIYKVGKLGPWYMKRFPVTSITRDKEYNLISNEKGSEIQYFSANPNGEAEVVTIYLKPSQRVKKLKFDVDFSELAIKGRASKGNIVSKHYVKKIELKETGVSTLAPRKIWFDDSIQRLNVDGRGTYLGTFKGTDKILTINSKGIAKLNTFDLLNHFEEDLLIIQKWKPEKPICCIYYEGEKSIYYIKRFLLEDTLNSQIFFISENPKSFIEWVGTGNKLIAEINFGKNKEQEIVNLEEFIAIKGIKAQGNQLSKEKIKNIKIIEESEEELEDEVEGKTSENNDDKSDDYEGEQINLF
ncbi:DNA gyrase/topoisomerase IV subunit A [Apibacter adventoris]|uniref:DNA gyrase/topoisomerase IV subunit A n=1 Tax=Apibacter adventoris TaxID=1679466 RepID=A0A2S8A8G0_9FLAO|nr:DNA gyrase/topoisomerase IV subunit A [Apibacter adventoris]PQL90852.1 DNA gyrase/topoisomerase IV subunit A [Apibacter adventoris]